MMQPGKMYASVRVEVHETDDFYIQREIIYETSAGPNFAEKNHRVRQIILAEKNEPNAPENVSTITFVPALDISHV